MSLMPIFGRLQALGLATALLVLSLAAACSRRSDFDAAGRSPSSRQQEVPFHSQAGSGSAEGMGDDSGSPRHPKNEADLPFRLPSSQTLAAGTLLTVRLQAPIATANRGASRTFAAVIDDPVVIDGTTVLPHGAVASGRLECSQVAPRRGHGYVCLTLESIAVGGETIPLQTSKLFAKGTVEALQEPLGGHPPAPAAVRIAKGHRLTFRLTRDVVLGAAAESTSDNPSGSK